MAMTWLENKDNGAIFLEMRMGKSIIAVLQSTVVWKGNVLLICPLSAMYDWERLLSFCDIRYTVFNGKCDIKLDRTNSQWVLVNSQRLLKSKELLTYQFNVCVLDESTTIKNPKAQITKLLLKHRNNFLHKLVLTGLPNPEGIEDFICQMIWCYGHFMECTSYWQWRSYYMYQTGFTWKVKPGILKTVIQEIKKLSFCMNTKQIGKYVEQVNQTYLVELHKLIIGDYNKCFRDWALPEKDTKYITVRDIWLAMLACGYYPHDMKKLDRPTKPSAIRTLLLSELQCKAVIFSRWIRETIDIAYELNCPYIIGVTPYSKRKQLLDRLHNGQIDYLVMQAKTAMRGLDLSCVDTAIVASSDWSYEIRYQLEHRLKHPEKQTVTMFVDCITQNTIEEKVLQVLKEKKRYNEEFLKRIRQVALG